MMYYINVWSGCVIQNDTKWIYGILQIGRRFIYIFISLEAMRIESPNKVVYVVDFYSFDFQKLGYWNL